MISKEAMETLEYYLPGFLYREIRFVLTSKQGKDFLRTLTPLGLISAILIVYFYWNCILLPQLFKQFNYTGTFWRVFCYGGGAFVFHGICGHYYFIAFRKCYVSIEDSVPFSYDTAEGFGDIGQRPDWETSTCLSAFDKLGLAPAKASKEWHPCFTCRAYVCPEAYHCVECQGCIRRRDHHCVISKNCIGLDNHVNFIGFILHMVVGTMATFSTGLLLNYKINGWTCLFNIFKTSAIFFGLLFGTDDLVQIFQNALIQLTFIGLLISSICFYQHVQMCCRGQTSFDLRCQKFLKLARPNPSFAQFDNFLGPSTLLKMIFPFYPIPEKGTRSDRREFINKFNQIKVESSTNVLISLQDD